MDDDPSEARTIAELDQARAGVDALADLLVHLDRRLCDAGFCEARRAEIVARWMWHRLSEESDD